MAGLQLGFPTPKLHALIYYSWDALTILGKKMSLPLRPKPWPEPSWTHLVNAWVREVARARSLSADTISSNPTSSDRSKRNPDRSTLTRHYLIDIVSFPQQFDNIADHNMAKTGFLQPVKATHLTCFTGPEQLELKTRIDNYTFLRWVLFFFLMNFVHCQIKSYCSVFLHEVGDVCIPKTKLSGLKICPKGPERTESMVPGSRSTRMALGTYFPPGKGI